MEPIQYEGSSGPEEEGASVDTGFELCCRMLLPVVDAPSTEQMFINKHESTEYQQINGPLGRLKKLSSTITQLVKLERIELNYPRADEARGYAERLISEAIRHGDTHRPTMELADFWLQEKQLVHKLFKVLAPRYKDYTTSYTRLFQAPNIYPGGHFNRAVLELKDNPFPPLLEELPNQRNLLHNVLLDEAKRDYRMKKYQQLSKAMQEASPACE